MNKKTLVVGILFIIFFMSLTGISSGSSIGSSTISLSSSSITVQQGSSQSVSYTVTLTSGTTWGTEITASSPTGISVSLSNPSGDPTFSGTADISVASSVSPGTYTVTFKATGDDPSTNSPSLSVQVTAVQKASGYSKITLAQDVVSLSASNETTIAYNVSLYNGTSGLTNLQYSGEGNLIISFSSPSGAPPFSGTMTVKGSSSASSGTYHIKIYATGSDPSISNATITVTYKSGASGSPSYIPYVLGFIVILIGLIGVIVARAYSNSRRKEVGASALVISSIVAIYLLVYDTSIRTLAPDHYYGLILFLILSIIGFIVTVGIRSLQRIASLTLFLGSLAFAILMVSDVFFGLPISKSSGISPAIGWNYLFGFGLTSVSFLSISLAFSILFISVMVLAGASLSIFEKSKN
ncbi:hypothetical protein ACNF40_06965 [Cuniculiplasma sp. SKW4]|uniref:hypothetical protein n=2 Tax=unclassified Cuniculiplasma TaxID=2619706 RepID=UPI003FD6330D